jgi:coenzyme F420-0:L-glutamate ligase/coenzyme F420-1:gamma-L-glutamate ligase
MGTGDAEFRHLFLVALPGIGEVRAGDDVGALILRTVAQSDWELRARDVLVIAQKIVSKAEGRSIALADVAPSARARGIAAAADKDPRLMELVLRESREVLKIKRGVVITEHRLGFIMANAGVDQSNVGGESGEECALLLPEDPDGSAARIRDALRTACGIDIGVIINDSFGRPWRNGVTGVAIGVAGIPALVDLRGRADRAGRVLKVTQVAAADELAAAASLIMGQADEGLPVVLARGFPYALRESVSGEVLRPREEDLFR